MEKKAQILVIDDELGIREGCKRVLLEDGYDVNDAEDGITGLQKIKEGSYDLLLVDLMMPGIGGLDLIKQVHEIDPEIILIVITGYATIETAVEATKRGGYDYLSKPFTPEALAAVVKRGLEKRALRLEAQRLQAEREKRLLELASEKSRLRTIISCMADGVLVVNKETELVLWNSAAVKMLRLHHTELSGSSLSHYIENKSIVEFFNEVLASDNKNVSMMSREFSWDNEGTILMANVAQIRDEAGDILGAVGILRDITKLKEIDKIKSQFVSMVAHELRAPLAAIEGWVEVVLSGEGGDDPEQNRKWLKRAGERAHTLLALVNDLLVINSMEVGRVAQKMETIRLKDVVSGIADFLQSEAEKQKVSIKVVFPDKLPTIQADMKDMEKLFTNLISNAIKYNVEGGSVLVEGTFDETYVCVRIKDTGVGISKENLPHIFDDFFRVDDEKTKKIQGTGLGLSIVKKVVDSHFGRIKVDSEPGKGSVFSVYLPREKK